MLKALVRWSNGIAIRYGDTKMLFDPVESDPLFPDLFISDAHYEHSRGFQFPVQKKYSTKETREIYEVDTSHKVGNWEPVRLGRRMKLGEVEVEAHAAGHHLGAVQFEVITAESNLVYAGRINFVDTLMASAAEVAPCDLLILETTFASPSQSLPPRESTVARIVRWALECVKDRRIPAFLTDHIGNAQELVRIFNTWTELPVIVHPRIARISRVYEAGGVALRYVDASTAESQSLIENAECVVIVPRGFDASRFGDFRTAQVSGWTARADEESGELFRLSDRADFNQLLRFVEEARPKTVFTFRGASRIFAQTLSKKLGITASELVTGTSLQKPLKPKLDEKRIAACQDAFEKFIQIQAFTYERADLLALAAKEGFKVPEIEEALSRLIKTGFLNYSELVDGYRLN